MASQGAVVSYPVGGGFPAASAPEATVAEWKAATIPVPENDVVAGGAKPSGSGPGTAEEIAPEALQAAMADNTNSAMAGHVDYMAIGIPSELKISNPATPHWRGAVVSVLLWGAVGFVLYERFTFSPTPPPACDDGEAGCSGSPADFTTDVDNQLPTISLAVLGVMYLIYLCESFRSDSRKYIWNFKDVAGSEAYLGRMVDQAPDIAMTGEAYHYETHFRTITTRDSNGNTSTRTETYTVKVVTFRTTEFFEYSAWKDESGAFHGLSLHTLAKLRLYKLLVWNDDESLRRFRRAYAHFQARHRWKDTHFSHSWNMRVSGFKTAMLSLRNPAAKPFWLSVGCFSVSTLLGCTWCWRRALTGASIEAAFTFRKIVRA